MSRIDLKIYTDATAGSGKFDDRTTLGMVVTINDVVILKTYRRTRYKNQHIIAAELLALNQAFAYLIQNRKKIFADLLPDNFCYAEDLCRIEIPFSVCSDNKGAVLICQRISNRLPLKKLSAFVPPTTLLQIEKFYRIYPAAVVDHVPGCFNPADNPSRARFHPVF